MRILSTVVILLLAALLGTGGAYLFVDDATLVGYLFSKVESATGAKISHQGDATISRTLSPTLSVDGLAVKANDAYRIQTNSLVLQIRLYPLLFGKLDVPKIHIGDTNIEILQAAETLTPQTPDKDIRGRPNLSIEPSIHDFQIGKLSITREGSQLQFTHLEIDELAIHFDREKHALELIALLDIAGTKVDVEAVLQELHRFREDQRFPFSLHAKGDWLELNADGQVALSKPSPSLEMEFHGQVSNLDKVITDIKDLSVPGNVSIQGRMAGTFDNLSMQDITATWHGPDQSKAELTGRITGSEGLDLKLQMQLGSAAWLAPVLPEDLDPVRSVKFSTEITGRAPRIKIANTTLNIVTDKDLDLSLSGQCNVSLGYKEFAITNMDFKVLFKAPTTKAARAMLFDDVPELGSVSGSVAIRSTTGDPAFDDIQVQVSDESGIQAKIKGRIARFPLDPSQPNSGYDLAVSAQAQDTAVLGERLGVELPPLNPLSTDFRIKGSTKALRVEDIRLSAGNKGTVYLGVTGKLSFGDWDQEDPLQELELTLSASGRDAKTIAALLQQPLPAIKPLTDSDWLPNGPVTLKGVLTSDGHKAGFDGGITVGTMEIDGKLQGSLEAEPISVSGSLSARNVWLPQHTRAEDDSKTTKKKKPKDNIFSRTPLSLDWLNKANLNLTVDVESFKSETSLLQSARFEMAMSPGLLSISPAKLVYPKGDLDLDVHIDGRDALQVKFRAHGNDLDPWQPLRIEQPNKDFQTKVSVDISIDSAGKSPHELAANAKGNIYLTAIDGKLRSSLIDLLLVDVVGWTLHRTTGQKYLDVDCGLADYSIDQGIISTTALFLEGKNIAITGTGTIDLGQEQIDYAILPKKKSRFVGKADPVTIKGPLNNPTVSALQWKSAAKTYGGYIFAPQFFIPLRLTEGLFGKKKKNEKSPCQEYKEAHDMSETGEKSQ